MKAVAAGLATTCALLAGAQLAPARRLAEGLPPNPPHGHWLLHAGQPMLVCDTSYYVSSASCRQPLVFRLLARADDRLPASIVAFTGQPLISRRLESVRAPSGARWRLYLAVGSRREDPTGDPCLEVSDARSYWGGLCVTGSELVSPAVSSHWLMGAGVLVGLTANTSDVRIVDSRGDTHLISPAHGGFVYFCAGLCGCDVRAVAAVGSGVAPILDDLRDPQTHRLGWCKRRG